MADVEPLLSGPTVVAPAEDALGEPALVRPPALPTADAYVADTLAAVGVDPVDGRLGGVEAVEVVGVHVEGVSCRGRAATAARPAPGGKTAGIAPAATTNPSSMAPMNVFIVRTPAAFSVDAR